MLMVPLLAIGLVVFQNREVNKQESYITDQVQDKPAVSSNSARAFEKEVQGAAPVFVREEMQNTSVNEGHAPEKVTIEEKKSRKTIRAKDQIPGEYVLSFFDAGDRNSFIALAKSRGVEIMDVMDVGNAVRIRTGERDVYEKLIKDGPVAVKQSGNYYTHIPSDPEEIYEDPGVGYVGFGSKSLAWMGLNIDNALWGKGVTVAVLDSGVDDNSLLEGVDIIRLSLLNDTAGSDAGYSSHGTAVASLIAGRTLEVRGVAPSSSVLSIQVMPKGGNGDTFTLAKGIVEAVDRGARVINISLGTSGDSFILQEAVNYALARQVVLVASAGNEAVNRVSYPAKYDGVVGVSGVDFTGRHLFFANRGPEVDVSAPAIGIDVAGPEGMVEKSSGTSFAAAIVSGTLAWILADDRDLQGSDAVDILLKSCNDTEAPGFDEDSGSGVVNIERILSRNEIGRYDIAICRPYIQKGDQENVVYLYIENRGTEDIAKVSMVVDVAGTKSYYDFYNVSVGEIESRAFPLDSNKLAAPDGIKIECTVSLDGLDDVHPWDNVLKGRILGGSQ